MSTANKRTSISDNVSANRLQNKLHENFNRFLKEADEDAPIDDAPVEDEDLGLDADLEDDVATDDGTGDLAGDFDPMAELGDSEQEQVESWVDEILNDSLGQVETEDGLLDSEVGADDLDPMGDNVELHDDLPLTASSLKGIIADDDSLAELEAALAALAAEGNNTGNEDTDLVPLEDDNESGLEDEDFNLDESDNFDLLESDDVPTEDNELMENEDPMKGIDTYFDQGFEGKETKDELSTDKKKVGSANKFKGINTNPTIGKVNAGGVKGGADSNVDVIKESRKRAAMLVQAANLIAKQSSFMESAKKAITKLKLENLKLKKANGILSESANVFSAESRIKIAEGFDKCGTAEQVNKFYEGLVAKIKSSNKSSLNEAVASKGKKNQILRESAKSEETEELSAQQERINYMMGMPTKNDMYLN